tara:strand:+ start:281 stop:2989 length:2709 start_codon:yes stop_codon:yes gene_type:complete
MTQSNFKYDSRQAGETLFQSKAEGGTFDKYYYRRPIENITNQLEKNKQIEAQSGRHTRDQVLENMQVEAQQALVTMQHDLEVDMLNQKYDMDQWSQFSKAAGELFTMWGEARKARQEEEGYLAIDQLQTAYPELYEDYIKKYDYFRNEDIDFKEKLKQGAWKALTEAGDLRMAKTLFSNSHWHDHVIREATLNDKLAEVPYFYQQNKAKLKHSFPELNGQSLTYDEWLATQDAKSMELKENEIINSKFIAANIVATKRAHFYKQGITPVVMSTKVNPVFAKLRSDQSLDEKIRHEEQLTNKFKEGNRLTAKNIITGGIGQGGEYSAQAFWKQVEMDAPGKDGATEKERRANAAADLLNKMLGMHGEKVPGINTIQLNQLANGKIYGGKEPGQHRGMNQGDFKELQDLMPEVFKRVDFWNRIEQTDMARRGIKTLNQENAQKMVVQAAVDQVKETGQPLSQVEQIEYARAASERGYGTFHDLYNAITDGVDTVHGISVEGWVGRIQNLYDAKGKLHKEDLAIGVPVEAMRDSRVKGMFYTDPKYHIKTSERRSLQNTFGRSIAGKQGKDIVGRPLAPPEYYDAGVNAWRQFKRYYDAEVAKGTNVEPEAAYEAAFSKVNADILKDKGEQFMGPIEPLAEFHKTVDANQKILSKGNIDEVQLVGFDDQVKFIKQRWADFKKGGYTGSVMRVFPDHLMYRPEDGSPSVNLFSPEFNSIAITVGGRERLIEGILKQEDGQGTERPKSDYDKPGKRVDPYYRFTIPPEISNQLSSKKGESVGQTFGTIDPWTLAKDLGFSERYLQEGVTSDDALQDMMKTVKRKCGVKDYETCTDEVLNTIRERYFRIMPQAFDIDFGEDYEHVFPTWNSVLDIEPDYWGRFWTGRQSPSDFRTGMENVKRRNRRTK